MTGDHTVERDFDELSQHDLKSGELKYGVPAALVVLLLVFAAIVAGLVPLLLAVPAATADRRSVRPAVPDSLRRRGSPRRPSRLTGGRRRRDAPRGRAAADDQTGDRHRQLMQADRSSHRRAERQSLDPPTEGRCS
jgi:hypothetical protein